ncbi:GspE/PulE family protein [Chitinimonas sp. BJYL2]|uniref:GspE/PulE family protein n=1 Tax=Chitinimonas sp. BJYL2 TaxID=2976696 RepID=UPI0022B30B5E|nr:GspE/PulE family protein [Chitinimonas sp. BJYL2]
MNAITPALLTELTASVGHDGWLGRLRERMGWDEVTALQQVAAYSGLVAVNAIQLAQWQPRLDLLPFSEASARHCVLFAQPDGALVLVLADPFNLPLRNWALQRLPFAFAIALVLAADLDDWFRQQDKAHRAVDDLALGDEQVGSMAEVTEISLASIAQDASPVVRLVNSTLYDALKSKASDIHFESTPVGLAIKYRIDGVLMSIASANGVPVAEQVLSRLKVLAELDISEKRVPQDGRFGVLIRGREVDFRVSIMPSIHGEDAVLRILDKRGADESWQKLSLDGLGLDDSARAALRQLAREPYGMLLVTGPTGSGKSTTLYATLSETNTGDEKIITIEDPVEYQLPGILQIPVNDRKGLSFARGLRSILRHDPDKILVGEIRDGETAQIAVQAALTGHLVLSSVHANGVFSVIDRFIHMGVEASSFVEALNGVVAQRLIRQICRECGSDDQPDAALIRESGLDPAACSHYRFRIGRGCPACRQSGYVGRRAIAEVLRLDDELKQAIVSHAPVLELRRLAEASGFVPMRWIALDCVARGETTLQEINRVTFVD